MADSPIMKTFEDADALAAAAAWFVYDTAHRAVQERGIFTLALAGGSTPKAAYERLARMPEYDAALWARTKIFLGDERFVPHDSADSNYGMARRSFLDAVPLPVANLFPVDTTFSTAQACADAYDRIIRRELGDTPLDLVINGLGDDGHTASLFPHAPALHVTNRAVTWSPPGTLPPPVDRITMTLARLNHSRNMLYLATGAKKSHTVRRVLRESPSIEECPAAHVRPDNGRLFWFLDDAAAGEL